MEKTTRTLPVESVEGEISLIIHYTSGESEALSVLSNTMGLITSLDNLDHCLLTGVASDLEPVSILNDIQHSSLKIMLARAIKKVPDNAINNLDWKIAVGNLLVKGKHSLLQMLDGTDTELQEVIVDLEEDYKKIPQADLYEYPRPLVTDVRKRLDEIKIVRSNFGDSKVSIQTEFGDFDLPYLSNYNNITEETAISENTLKDISLVIESLNFKDGNKWRFNDGNQSFSAIIKDNAFIDKINRGEAFSKGDMLTVSMTIKQTTINDKIKTEYNIICVTKHIKTTKPQRLAL